MHAGGMGIARLVRIGVVCAMQDGVRLGLQIARALGEIRAEMEEALPAPAHRKHSMRAVSMQKEALKEDADLPMQQEEQQEWQRQAHALHSCNHSAQTQPGVGHVLVSKGPSTP